MDTKSKATQNIQTSINETCTLYKLKAEKSRWEFPSRVIKGRQINDLTAQKETILHFQT